MISRFIEALERIDTAILAKVFQPLSDWSLRELDRSCYWLAQQCAFAGVPANIYDIYLRQTPASWVFGPLNIALMIWLSYLFGRRDREFRDRPAVPPSPLPISPWQRWIVLIACVLDIVFHLEPLQLLVCLWLDIAFGLALYFASCIPRPPQMRDHRAPADVALNHGSA